MATNTTNPSKKKEDAEAKKGSGCLYVKVNMDGAPYLRKVDLKMYANYKELSFALEKMCSCFTIGQCGSHGIPAKDGQGESRMTDHGSKNVLTYEDKDGDWMLVGDVPWDMFTKTYRRLGIMKGSDSIGLGDEYRSPVLGSVKEWIQPTLSIKTCLLKNFRNKAIAIGLVNTDAPLNDEA